MYVDVQQAVNLAVLLSKEAEMNSRESALDLVVLRPKAYFPALKGLL